MPIQHATMRSKNCVLENGRLYKVNSYDWYYDKVVSVFISEETNTLKQMNEVNH